MMQTSVRPIRIPYASSIKIHENTLFSKISGDSVFRYETGLGHYGENFEGLAVFGEPLFLIILLSVNSLTLPRQAPPAVYAA